SVSPEGDYSEIGDTVLPSYLVTNLSENTPYYFKVSCIDAVGDESDKSEYICVTTLDKSSYPSAIWAEDQDLSQKGDYDFAGVYEFNNLTIEDNVQIKGSGISQLVIRVYGKLVLGKNVTIRVRNAYYYYSEAPLNSISILDSNNYESIGIEFDGYRLYDNMFGKGGDGGDGGRGSSGFAGGGGAGGFGGGKGGEGGIGQSNTTNEHSNGKDGNDNGGIGGSGGHGVIRPSSSNIYNKQYGKGGYAGVGLDLRANNDRKNGDNGSDTSHGAEGGCGGESTSGGGGGGGGAFSYYYSHPGGYTVERYYGGGGGGAGGYGGGILVISAEELIFDEAFPPKFFVSGQKGGKGGKSAVVSGYYDGDDGENGEGGLLIINAPNYEFDSKHWSLHENTYGDNASADKFGHGTITGNPQKVFVNGVDVTDI
ncbi:MAG: fibronectin type III domain-containing protein, partial [Desulfobacterales bacterium]|nr:fibronectin type III domain-containing protein [Desulfobacterales bacterium]